MGGLSDSDRRLVLEWGSGLTVAVPPTTLAGLTEDAVRARPDGVAVAQGPIRLTYRALDAAATRMAWRLRAAGARPNVAVGVAVPRTPAMVVALLAVLKSGAHYVPLDPALPPDRLRSMLVDAAPVACVVTAATRPSLPRGPWLLVDLTAAQASGGPGDGSGSGDGRGSGGGSGSGGGEGGGGGFGGGSGDPSGSGGGFLNGGGPGDLACVLFIAGGDTPRGVCVEHRSAVDLVVTSAIAYAVGPADRMLSATGIHSDASVAEIFTALAVGATLVVASEHDLATPDALQALLADRRITAARLPEHLLGRLDPTRLPELRLLVVGGDELQPGQVGRWVAAGVRVIHAYGSAETTGTATMMECPARPLSTVPIGRPAANHRLYVVDDAGCLVAPGAAGELWIGGPGVARGYLGLPELTAERFVPDRFTRRPGARLYRSGDTVAWNSDGTLELRGRRVADQHAG